jgi:ribonuclease D
MTTEMTSQVETFTSDIPREVLKEFTRGGVVAWDIETSGLNPRADRIATCQLANRDGAVFLVRVTQSRPENLSRLLSDPRVQKVFHYAVFDLSFLVTAWDVVPANIACTKVCSRILDPSLKDHTLKRLLFDNLNITIDKAQRLSDWFADSLSFEQTEYAANDVRHLIHLFEHLEERLEERNLGGLSQECFRHLATRVTLELGQFGDVFSY